MPVRPASIVLSCALVLAAAPGALGDDDHDRARAAMSAGRILPLERILEQATARFGGEILDVELDDDHGRARYELKVIGADGRVLRLDYDATTGELLSVRGRGHGRGGRR